MRSNIVIVLKNILLCFALSISIKQSNYISVSTCKLNTQVNNKLDHSGESTVLYSNVVEFQFG